MDATYFTVLYFLTAVKHNVIQPDKLLTLQLMHGQLFMTYVRSLLHKAAAIHRGLLRLQAGKYEKAVAIMGRNQWWHKLNQVVSQLTPSNATQAAALQNCAAFFRRGGQTQFAKEAYAKLQDYSVSVLVSKAPMPCLDCHIARRC